MIFVFVVVVFGALRQLNLVKLSDPEIRWLKSRKSARLWLALTLKSASAMRLEGYITRVHVRNDISTKVTLMESDLAARPELMEKLKWSLNVTFYGMDEFYMGHHYLDERAKDHLKWVKVYSTILNNQNKEANMMWGLKFDKQLQDIYQIIASWYVDDDMLDLQKNSLQQVIINSLYNDIDFETSTCRQDVANLLQELATTLNNSTHTVVQLHQEAKTIKQMPMKK